ncbi:MAG TPA: carbohydrate porin [Burkholderiaceae bacterium]
MKTHTLRATAIAAALLAAAMSATAADETATESQSAPAAAAPALNVAEAAAKKALDDLGIQLWGYMRSGAYGSAKGEPKGQYQLSYGSGSDIDHYRFGNEGDNYLEFGIGKKWDMGGGLKWGTYWMPTYYNGATNTAQVYTDMTGLDFLPGATIWAGQRYHRIQDVHILDNWVMEDGDNYGAGIDNIGVGFGKLNFSASTEGNSGNLNSNVNNAKRVNFQWHDMPTNPGGTLTLTGAYIRGQFADKNNGYALGALHNQKDFLVKGLINSLFLQTSTGHAAVKGEFFNLDSAGAAPLAGAKQSRIIESMNWQFGKLGGQAVIGYHVVKPDAVGGLAAPRTKNFSAGGEVTYGVAKNTKLIGELGYNNLKTDGLGTQNLDKEVIAVAFAPNTDFWTRPEFRVYLQRAGWNGAAQLANSAAGQFGATGKTSAITFGAQVEAWW